MRELKHFIEPPRACDYLPDLSATLEHRMLLDVRPTELEELLVRGWRRFGPLYFRPVCAACAECVSIRIPVDRFKPTESQLRARRRCKRFRLEVGAPRVDEMRLGLYHKWHAMRRDTRGWRDSELDLEGYFYQLAFPHPCARELTLWNGDTLVAVSLCDVTPHCWSAIYFFYDPDFARLSPGVANVMLCLEQAREHGATHVYLGYRVQECASLRYKSSYHPHELLLGRPGLRDAPVWLPEEDYPKPAPLASAPDDDAD